MAQDLNGSNVNPAKNIVKVNVLRANVKQTKVIDTDIVFVLEDGRTVFIRDGAVQSLLDNGFSVEFSDGDLASGQELLQSAGAAEISSVALTGPQAASNEGVIVAQAPQAVGTSPVAQPSSGGGLKTWLAIGTPLVGGALGGVLGGGGAGAAATAAAPSPTPTADTGTTTTGTGTTANAKPATPVINVVADDDKVNAAEKAAAAGVSVAGTAEAGASLTVNWGNTSKSVTADSSGRWSASFASAELPIDATGTTISATVKSSAGVSSDPATRTVQIDTTPPAAPVIANVAGDNVIGPTEKASGVNINGTAEAGSTVSVGFGGINKTVSADLGGNWSVNYKPEEVPVAGNYAVTASARDANGNVGAALASRPIIVAAAITVTGQIVAGPVIAGNGLSVEIYRANGTLLVSGIRVSGDGTFTATDLPIGAGDVIYARVVDNTNAADYLDEATGAPVDLNAVLLAVKVVEGTSVTMSINPLTTIAAIKAGLAPDGSGTIANAAAAKNANTATAQAFGLSGIDITTTSAVATNSGGYNAADGLSSGEKIGAVLAALSGLDGRNAGNSQTTITNLSQSVKVDGNIGQLTSQGQVLLMSGAGASEDKVDGALQTLISDSVAGSSPVTQVTINTIAKDNIIIANEAAGLTLSGTVSADVTGVSLLFGTRTVAATLNGTAWTYTLSADDVTAFGADGAKVIQAQATLSNATSVSAWRMVTLKISPPATPSLDLISGDNGINAKEKGDGVGFSGTGEAGSTIVLTFGNITKNVVVDATGTWTTGFLAAEIPADGTSTVSLSAQDNFGNVSSTVTRPIRIDTIAPAAPTVEALTGDDLIGPTEKVGGVAIRGTADGFGIVRLTIGNVVRTTTADARGNWTINLLSSQIPEDGEYSLTVTQADGVGNVSAEASRTVKVDAQPPAKPVILPVASDNIVNAAEKLNGVTIRGTAEPNVSIELTWGAITRIVKASANGTWSSSFTGPQIPADGLVNVTAIATDSSGSISEPATRAVTIDTVSQNLTIDSVATDDIINAAEKAVNVVVTGKAEAGAKVEVTLGGVTLTELANQAGVWVVNFKSAEIPPDTDLTTVTARSTDQAANISGLVGRDIRIDTVLPGAPVIDKVAGDDVINQIESPTSVVVSGQAEAGALVTVTWGDVSRRVNADADGKWTTSFRPADLQLGGASVITATARDSALNFSVATERPVLFDVDTPLPAISMIADNDIINATERTNGVLVSGTAEAFATVRLVWGTVVKNPVADKDGKWEQLFVAAEIPLANSPTGNSITATATDKYGNISPGVAANRSFTVDTQVDPAIFDNVAGTDNIVNSSEKNVGVAVSGEAEAGSTVVVTWGGKVKEVTANASRRWEANFTASDIPADGSSTITAVVTDMAGNVSVQSTKPVTIDTTAPIQPIINIVAGDNIVNKSERDSADGVIVSGKAEVGARVFVRWGAGGLLKDVATDANGDWSVKFLGAEMNGGGATQIFAYQVDAAGNTGDVQTRDVTVALGAPPAPGIDLTILGGDAIVNIAEYSTVGGMAISGTGVAGNKVILSWGNFVSPEIDVVAGGTWSYTVQGSAVTPLFNTTTTISVRQIDPDGNQSLTAATREIRIDRTAPIGGEITSQAGSAQNDDRTININERASGLLLRGTAPADATLVRITGTANGITKTVDVPVSSGSWSYSVASTDLPAATINNVGFSVQSIDAAGNVGNSTTLDYNFDLTPPLAPPSVTFGGSDNEVSILEADVNNAASPIVVAGSLATGHGAAKVVVSWIVDGTAYTQETSVTAGASTWSLNWNKGRLPSADGAYVANVYTVDAAGNASALVPVDLTVNRRVPATPSFTSIGAGSDYTINIEENASATLEVKGAGATVGATVFLTLGTSSTIVGSATVQAGGLWTINLARADYPTDDGNFNVYQVLPNTNRSVAVSQLVTVDLTPPVAPTITAPSGISLATDAFINAGERPSGLTLSGGATGARKVLLTWTAGSTPYSKEVDVAGGQWSYTIAAAELPLGNGFTPTDLVISARAIDAAGNRSTGVAQQTYSVDTSAPAAVTGVTFGGSDNEISVLEADVNNAATSIVVTGALLSGHGAAKVVVSWIVDGTTYAQETAVTADARTWSLNWNKARLPSADGGYVANVFAVDAAGNASALVPVNLTVNRGIPATPSFTSIGTGNDYVINIAENAAATLEVKGAGATVGATVFLTLGTSTTVVGSATVQAGGVWTINLAQANYPTNDGNFNVYQVLPNSNRSAAVSQSVTLDLTPPASPTISPPLSSILFFDAFINASERPSGLNLSGAATGSRKVLLTWTTGSTPYSKEVVVSSDAWSYTIAATELPSGTPASALVIYAQAIDAAGNLSAGIAQQTYTIDTQAPAAVTGVTFAGDNIVNLAESNQASLNFTGNLSANHGAKKITIFWNGHSESFDLSDETTAVTGWTIAWPQSKLPSSNSSTAMIYTFDAANNRTDVSRVVTNDRAAPSTLTNVVVAGDNKINSAESSATDITITGGGAVSGATVFVTLGGVQGQTSTIAGNGTWSVTIPTSSVNFNAGNLALSAFQRNGVGNDSAPVTNTILVDTAPPAVLTLGDVATDNRINAVEAGGTINLMGTTDAGISSVTVAWGGGTPKNAVVTTIGGTAIWDASFTTAERSAIVDGIPVRITVVATDDFGNQKTTFRDISVDTSAPTGLTVNTGVAADGVNIEEATTAGVTISGTAENGASVNVNWNGRSQSVTATTGIWSVYYSTNRASNTGIPDIDGAAVNLTVTQTDAVGNSQAISQGIRIDTVAPTQSVAALLGMSNDYGTSGDQITARNNITLVGRGAAGEFVELFINGSPTANRVTVNSKGIWTYTGSNLNFADVAFGSTITLSGRAVDLVQNTSGAATSFTAVQRQLPSQTLVELGVLQGTSTPGLTPLVNNVAVQSGAQMSGIYLYGTTGFGGGDQFGSAVAVGDVNNDQIPDLIIGARKADNIDLSGPSVSTLDIGEVNIIYGKADWSGTSVIDTLKLGTGGYAVRGDAAVNDTFGANVAFLGDVNGDGRGDIASMAFLGDNGAVADTGSVYVLFSPSTNTPGTRQTNAGTGADKYVSSVSTMTKESGFIFRGLVGPTTLTADRPGVGLIGAQLNKNDTVSDIVIGIPGYDRTAASGLGATPDVGAVAIIFGRADGNYTNVAASAKQELDINSLVAPGSLGAGAAGAEGFLIRGHSGSASWDALFGASIGKGDFNGDGIEDLIIGSPAYEITNANNNIGAAYVIYGKADKTAWNAILTDDPSRPNAGGTGVAGKVLDVSNLTAAHGYRITGEIQGNANLGLSVRSAGDVNGDGIDDMIMGAPNWDQPTGGLNHGAAYVVFGKAGNTRASVDLTSLTSAEGFIIRTPTSAENLGASVAGVGDVNGDGYGDIVVTVPLTDRTVSGTTTTDWGNVYLILGKAEGSIYGSLSGGRSILNVNEFSAGDGVIFVGRTINARVGGGNDIAGTSVTAAGDLNKDGFADFIIGAPNTAANGRTQAGESYIIFGSAGLGGLTQSGASGADTLIGGTFNDIMTGLGGADNILTFDGNDMIIVSDLAFNFIDGGAGTDTLRLAGGTDLNLDLSALAAGTLKDIEQIDLVAGSLNNTLTVTQQTLLDLSSTSNRLTVLGGAGDTVNANGFTAGAIQVVNGITYKTYTNGAAELWVQQDVTVAGTIAPPAGFVPPAISWAEQAVLAA